MYKKMLTLFICLFYIKSKVYLAEASRKFVDHRDISEQCRRRVVPSLFLGQRVMGVNSHVIQLSQLEVPYSCTLSVRAESGTNIILVVELQSEDSLDDACNLSGEQLIVYEFGETFGGYWGMIPDTMMEQSALKYTRYYTLKPTKRYTRRTRKKHTKSVKILTQIETQSTSKEQEYFTIDVPIVNVSGSFQLGSTTETQDSEDMFDFIYNVTPRNGVEYETSILPLVQFSIRQQKNSYEGEDARYELDYGVRGLTMDPRLKFNTMKKKTTRRRDWRASKRSRHRNKSTAAFLRRDYGSNYKKMFKGRYKNNNTPFIPALDPKYFTYSREIMDDIVKLNNITTIKSATFQNILNFTSNTEPNTSVNLSPNISIYNVDNSTNKTKIKVQETTDLDLLMRNISIPVEINTNILMTSLLKNPEEKPTLANIGLDALRTDYGLGIINVDSEFNSTDEHEITNFEGIQKYNTSTLNANHYFNTTDKLLTVNQSVSTTYTSIFYQSSRKSFLTGALVDHESWENIVQAAPVMAVVLNNTEPNTHNEVIKKRKKRHIQPLEVDQSHPKNLTRKPLLETNTPLSNNMEDLARIVELQDDEVRTPFRCVQIGSRVALRYLRHYVGPALFNLCDYRDSNLRQTFLFNSSRIVISINNFSIDRMVLVLTPAQTITNGLSQCQADQLECQIVGTRVCIDSLNACDGVPNCGSYEIYDEDRLTCGVSHGIQHNVGLAALTFLAVILTSLYITTYWLKRCVPRVSEAFFVYTESSESELLLDTIMRSPNDNEDPFNRIIYPGHFFEDDVLYEDINAEKSKRNFCIKLLQDCWRFLFCKRNLKEKLSKDLITDDHVMRKEPTKMFSFTELQLRKFTKAGLIEEGVQTGNEIEMKELNYEENKTDCYSLRSWTKFRTNSKISDSELNLIKFSKDSRSLSQSTSISIENADVIGAKHTGTDKELVIKNIIYDPNITRSQNKIPVICEVHSETKGMGESSKRLRFDEELQMIPSNDDSMANSSTIVRLRDEDLDIIEEVEENENIARDFMRFWGAKVKKSKKKKRNI